MYACMLAAFSLCLPPCPIPFSLPSAPGLTQICLRPRIEEEEEKETSLWEGKRELGGNERFIRQEKRTVEVHGEMS